MKKNIIGLVSAVALLSVVTAGVGKANAYFTTYAQARGGPVIELGDETTIEENYDGSKKVVRIKNSVDSKQAVWVRAKGITGMEYQDLLDYKQSGNDWEKDDEGFYVYKYPVLPGKWPDTDLTIEVSDVPIEDGKSIDIVVVYESTPAIQNDIGAYEDPDWNADDMTRKTEIVE